MQQHDSQYPKDGNHPSVHQQTDKQMYIHAMVYNSALKKILTHATTWMSFEEIVLTEISQTQNDKHCMTPLIQDT